MLSLISQSTLEERAQLLLPRLLSLKKTAHLAPLSSVPPLTPEEEASLSVEELRERLAALVAKRFELRRRRRALDGSDEPESNVVPLETILNERARVEAKNAEVEWRRRRARGDAAAQRMELSEHLSFSDQIIEERISKAIAAHSRKRSRLDQMGAVTSAYRVAGTSCFSVAGLPRHVGVRFDPVAFGHYAKERYYVVLDARLKVFRHNLPSFVPVASLEAAFLPVDPAGFFKRAGRYCAALQARAFEARRIADEYRREGRGDVTWTPSRDVITLRGRFQIDVDGMLGSKTSVDVDSRGQAKNRVATSVTLRFGHLLDTIPDEVSLEIEDEASPLIITSNIVHAEYEARVDFQFGMLIEQALGRMG